MNLEEPQKEHSPLESYLPQNSTIHYSVPQGYFDGLNESIISKIEILEAQSSDSASSLRGEDVNIVTAPSLYQRVKPTLFLAASFVSIFFSFKVLLFVKDYYIALNTKSSTNTKDELYLNYYEDYAVRVIYNEEEHLWDEVQYNM